MKHTKGVRSLCEGNVSVFIEVALLNPPQVQQLICVLGWVVRYRMPYGLTLLATSTTILSVTGKILSWLWYACVP